MNITKRRFTIYFRDNGFKLIKELFRLKKYTFEQFFDWFLPAIEISEESLKTNTESSKIYSSLLMNLLKNLIGLNILRKKEDFYFFTDNTLDGLIRLVNIRKIRDYNLEFHEKELYSNLAIISYYEKGFSNYFGTLCSLGNAYLERLEYWNKLGLHPLLYIKAQFCYEELSKQNANIDSYKSSYVGEYNALQQGIKQHESLKLHKDYKKITHHYKKCFKLQCSECGGNILNYVKLFVEKIRREILGEALIKEIIVKAKLLKFISNENEINLLFEFLRKNTKILRKKYEYEWKVFKKKSDKYNAEIRYGILLHFISELQSLFHLLILFKSRTLEGKSQSNNQKVMENITLFKEYMNKLTEHIKDNSLLDSIDSQLIQRFEYNKKVFSQYSQTINRIGRHGEKCIYEGLKEQYKSNNDIKVIWKNKNKETGHPYDILIKNEDSTKSEYIEVKTTHSQNATFYMSENEINFAMDKKDKYTIYLIINAGAGVNSYYEVIENFYQKFTDKNDKRIETKSRILAYY